MARRRGTLTICNDLANGYEAGMSKKRTKHIGGQLPGHAAGGGLVTHALLQNGWGSRAHLSEGAAMHLKKNVGINRSGTE